MSGEGEVAFCDEEETYEKSSDSETDSEEYVPAPIGTFLSLPYNLLSS